MIRYYEVYRMKAERHILRQRVVEWAREHGITAATREFACARNTVRKWLRRHQPGKPSSLREISRRPHHCPHQTPAATEGLVMRLRNQTGFGAQRLKMEFDVPCSVGAIKRIVRQHGGVRPRKKKRQVKRILRDIKAKWPLFGQLNADTKYLQDIPAYWWQMQKLGLPPFQYTVREVVSGLTLCGYADELSKTYSTLLAHYVSAHLAWHGVALDQVEWQTDNGSEFREDGQHRGLPSTVRALGSDHHYIPPKAYTWQSDVETVHALQETEFFDRELFRSKPEFWKKITTYWRYFNIARPNSNKHWRTPLDIIRQRAPQLDPAIASWQALDLGQVLRQYIPNYHPSPGHDVPVHPCFYFFVSPQLRGERLTGTVRPLADARAGYLGEGRRMG